MGQWGPRALPPPSSLLHRRHPMGGPTYTTILSPCLLVGVGHSTLNTTAKTLSRRMRALACDGNGSPSY
eukprot:scaffold263691_cov36-Tisochrysis_lutea.AAC.4